MCIACTDQLQHYDFHHFILNRALGYDNKAVFSYSTDPTAATPKHLLPTHQAAEDQANLLTTAADRKLEAAKVIPDAELEGYSDDPAVTKVVDRRWYERNKHIYPASVWEDFDPAHDYSKGGRKDGQGNAFFFSR